MMRKVLSLIFLIVIFPQFVQSEPLSYPGGCDVKMVYAYVVPGENAQAGSGNNLTINSKGTPVNTGGSSGKQSFYIYAWAIYYNSSGIDGNWTYNGFYQGYVDIASLSGWIDISSITSVAGNGGSIGKYLATLPHDGCVKLQNCPPGAYPGFYWPFPVGSHLSQSEVPTAPPEGCSVPDCTLMEQVMTNGSCGAKSCPEGLELNPDGTCSGSCPSYQELFEGKCVDRCDAGFQRDLQGHCTASCPPRKEIVLGVCQDKCPSDQTRNTDGTCPDPCANKRQDAANKCSTGYVMAADCSYTCDSCSAALSSCITRCATLGGIMTNTCSQSYGSDCQCKNDLISSDPNLKQGTTTDIKTVTNSDGSKTTTETVDVTSPDGTHTKTVTTKDYDSSGNEIGSNKVVTESKGSGSDSDSDPDNNHLPPYSSGGDGLDFNEWSGIGSAVSRTLPVQYITGILEYISAFNVSGSAPIFSIPMGSYGDLNCDLSIFNPVVSVFRSLIAIFFNVGMILVTIKLWSRWG